MVLSLVLVIVGASFASGIFVLNLNGKWTVSCAEKGVTTSGHVPGSMYTALYNNKVIPNPLYRDNDVQLAWVGHLNWTYSRDFELSNELTQSDAIILVAEGVDTVSTISINGQEVGRTDNMFVKYFFDIRSFVKPGNNTISVNFQSATEYAAKQFASYPYMVPPNCTVPVQNGECHVNFIRKEQCSFSWDWGPSFPTQGVWKPIYIEAFSAAILDTATVEVMPVNEGWQLRTKTYYNVSIIANVFGQLVISLEGTSISRTLHLTLSAANNWVDFNISVPQSENIQRWWPNGYGNQTMYNVYFVFTASNGDVTSTMKRIGCRKIELVQDPVSANTDQGLSFYFRVNDMPIFMKGSNWIPADSFQERITKDQLRSLLQSAADVHMNCMRVWGGGVFESEDFYDLTDELGILIWQDLMFSVAMYPTHQPFLDTVVQEVRHQVRRLMHRPSILLWAGSNENEKALRQNWFGTNSNYTLYYNDFVKLYVTTVMPVVTTEDPSRVYLTSSPSNGVETVREGYVAKDPGSELYGDIHFYDYAMNQWQPDHFRIPRFASEYGIQAWCNYETLVTVLDVSDMSYTSAQAEHRQHHTGGGAEMEGEILQHMNIPPSTIREPQRFQHFIYLTQINQAMSIKSQTEHYRRYQSRLLGDGRGLTMGALYWQLNDIWQAPTWASIDYDGRWKMLHYYAVHFFGPTLVSPFFDGNFLDVYIVIDELPTREARYLPSQELRFEPVTQFGDLPRERAFELRTKVMGQVRGVLNVAMYSWRHFTPLQQWTVNYQLNSTAESVMRQNISSMLDEAGCTSREDCFIHMYVNDPVDNIGNWIYLAELKDSTVQNNTGLRVAELHQDNDSEFTMTLFSDYPAPFVWLTAEGIHGKFSDNGFLMYRPTAIVNFYAWEPVDYTTLLNALRVQSLSDVYTVV